MKKDNIVHKHPNNTIHLTLTQETTSGHGLTLHHACMGLTIGALTLSSTCIFYTFEHGGDLKEIVVCSTS